MASLPGELDGRRFLRAMARFGWTVASQKGSHRKLVNTEQPGILIVAFHRTLGRNSVRRVLRQAGISEEEFVRAI
jgi:predicted RNA binding protein YcfA (HicA-like mRNA interferase family)